MDFSNQRDRTIILRERNRIRQIHIEEILYIECNGYLSTIFLVNSKRQESYCKLLKDIEKELVDFGFVRINRNILVNMKYFEYNIGGSKRCIVLINNIQIQVSRRRWYAVKEFMGG